MGSPVKNNLSGRQYMVTGKDSHGRETKLYISNEVDGLLHLNLSGKELWIGTDELIDIIGLLKHGDAYAQSLMRVKEARHAKGGSNEV